MSDGALDSSVGDPRTTRDVHAPQLFKDAVETFIDLYKFVMALAIGNCFRSLAQRQIQFKLDSDGGFLVKLSNVNLYDSMMFIAVLIFIARFFFGDMAYWKAYRHRKNGKILISDALILLVNAFALTYMSFFIGYNSVVGIVILGVLAADVGWAGVGLLSGKSRATANAFSAVRLGVLNSLLTLIVVAILVGFGILPHRWSDLQQLSDSGNRWILGVLTFNTLADLGINGGRYLGRTEDHWMLQLKLLLQLQHPDKT